MTDAERLREIADSGVLRGGSFENDLRAIADRLEKREEFVMAAKNLALPYLYDDCKTWGPHWLAFMAAYRAMKEAEGE